MTYQNTENNILDQFDTFEIVHSRFKLLGYAFFVPLISLCIILWGTYNLYFQTGLEEERWFFVAGIGFALILIFDIYRNLWRVSLRTDRLEFEHLLSHSRKVIYLADIKTYRFRKRRDHNEVFEIEYEDVRFHDIREEFYGNYKQLKAAFMERTKPDFVEKGVD
ncbi:MAG: hypothetical protein AAF502_11350 [Bacteroidota bacterium]